MEKTFQHKDRKFNCTSKTPILEGDPCVHVDAYYAKGPAFPRKLLAKIDKDLDGIEIEWEHGDMISLSLDFKAPLSICEVVRRYALPTPTCYPAWVGDDFATNALEGVLRSDTPGLRMPGAPRSLPP